MTEATQAWLLELASNDDDRTQIIKQLLTHATEDKMTEIDRGICLNALQKLSGYRWLWEERLTSRDLDTITCLEKFTVN